MFGAAFFEKFCEKLQKFYVAQKIERCLWERCRRWWRWDLQQSEFGKCVNQLVINYLPMNWEWFILLYSSLHQKKGQTSFLLWRSSTDNSVTATLHPRTSSQHLVDSLLRTEFQYTCGYREKLTESESLIPSWTWMLTA